MVHAEHEDRSVSSATFGFVHIERVTMDFIETFGTFGNLGSFCLFDRMLLA